MHSNDKTCRLVSHLGASLERLNNQEVVTLCLLIYFRGSWTTDEITEKVVDVQRSFLLVCLSKYNVLPKESDRNQEPFREDLYFYHN